MKLGTSSSGLVATPAWGIHAYDVEKYASVVYCQGSRVELSFDSHVPEVAAGLFVWAELFERETALEISVELDYIGVYNDLFWYGSLV